MLGLSGGAWRRNHLAQFGSWLTAGRGILFLAQVIDGEVEDRIERREEEENKLRKFIADGDLEAFPSVVVEPNLLDGVKSLLQCCGVGGVRPNTVLLGWMENPEQRARFAQILRLVRDMERSILLIHSPEQEDRLFAAPLGSIDIGWKGGRNGALMLLLAHLLTLNPAWPNHPIRLVFAVPENGDVVKAQEQLTKLTEGARVKAALEIVTGADAIAAMRTCSQNAALVMMGFVPPDENDKVDAIERTRAEIGDLARVILVYSAGGHSLSA